MASTLELCCGTKSFSKVAVKLGYHTTTVDIDAKFQPDICVDILDFDPSPYVNKIDVLWMSPPCTEFSLTKTTKTRNITSGVNLVKRCKEILKIIKPKYYVFENPVGFLNKLGLLDEFPKKTVSYCKYGFNYRKSTHLWTNIDFKAKVCAHDCHATIAPSIGKKYHKEIISGRKSQLKPFQSRKKTKFGVIPPDLIECMLKACV